MFSKRRRTTRLASYGLPRPRRPRKLRTMQYRPFSSRMRFERAILVVLRGRRHCMFLMDTGAASISRHAPWLALVAHGRAIQTTMRSDFEKEPRCLHRYACGCTIILLFHLRPPTSLVVCQGPRSSSSHVIYDDGVYRSPYMSKLRRVSAYCYLFER